MKDNTTAAKGDPRFEVRDVNAEQALRDIGEVLKTAVPKGMGFTFFLFDYGKDGGMFYISTADRADMISSMQEFIGKQEGTHQFTNQQLQNIHQWLLGDDTGLSSKYLAGVFLAVPATLALHSSVVPYPLDPSDFGRCYRFLDMLTPSQVRVALERAAKQSPKWMTILQHWDELVAMFNDEKGQSRAPKLYHRMKSLGL